MFNNWYEKTKIVEAIVDNDKLYYLVDENYNFIPFIKEFIDSIAARANRAVAPNTIKNYCYLLRHFVIFIKMRELNILDFDGKPELLAEFKLWLKNPYRLYENVTAIDVDLHEIKIENELTPTTINEVIDRVSSLYNYLFASKKISINPVIYKNVTISAKGMDRDMLTHTRSSHTIRKNLLKTKPIKKAIKIISQNDFKKILASTNLLRDKIILLILKEGGLRSGELLGIKLEDIDFGEQGIWVRFRPDNINNSRAKAGYGRDRFVHLPVSLIALIDAYINTDWISTDPNNDYLFVVVNSKNHDYIGQPMKKTTLDSFFRALKNRTGINIYPHMLRHTHATELARMYIDKGEPIDWKFISQRLGHASITTTIEIYSHLNREDLKKEYARLNKGVR